MTKQLRRLWQDEDGISAVEYALLAAGIAAAVIAGAALVGDALSNRFNNLANEIEGE
jgi:pilus assembly protein Flp/PilA